MKLKFDLVGGLEPWNFMTFHFIYGNVIIPTDDSSIIFQRAGAKNPPTRAGTSTTDAS